MKGKMEEIDDTCGGGGGGGGGGEQTQISVAGK